MCSNISTTFAPPNPEQAFQSPPPVLRGNLLPIHLFMFFFVCLFFFLFSPFFAVGLFKCPTIIKVGHPTFGCICPRCSLAKQNINIFIKHYLQSGDEDLAPHKALAFTPPRLMSPPSLNSILNDLCVTYDTNKTCQSEKKHTLLHLKITRFILSSKDGCFLGAIPHGLATWGLQ